jgi:LmbE family N-acetylglucosaminyl deacetylase
MKRLLCVFAHPDDECLGPGGAIAQCVLNGVEVFVTTLTAGEAGSIGISRSLAPEELARRRRREMADACAALGVAGHRIVGAPDGGVADLDRDAAVGEIVADIQHFRPQVALTFHRAGVSGHPDHIAVTQYLGEAIARTGEHGPRACWGWGIARHRVPLYNRPKLVPLPDEEIAAVVTVRPEAMDMKIAAIRAHGTQIAFFDELQSMFDFREVSSPEYFALSHWRGERPPLPVTDLFEGVDV